MRVQAAWLPDETLLCDPQADQLMVRKNALGETTAQYVSVVDTAVYTRWRPNSRKHLAKSGWNCINSSSPDPLMIPRD